MNKEMLDKIWDIIGKESINVEPPPPPPIGTKEWFHYYVGSIIEHSKVRITPEKAEECFVNLEKFDPNFAKLAKEAHVTAIALMDYANTKMENK